MINEIDKKYWESKKKKLSRFSAEWAAIIFDFTAEIKSKHKTVTAMYQQLLIYLKIRSELLELFHKSKMGDLGKKKRLEHKLGEIKKMVMTGRMKSVSEIEFIKKMI